MAERPRHESDAQGASSRQAGAASREGKPSLLARAARLSADTARRAPLWLRYRGWLVAVHAALLAFGLVNIYPFLWMTGTSFKSVSEAATERHDPVPRVKYRLSAAGRGAIPRDIGEAGLRQLSSMVTEYEARARGGASRWSWGDAPSVTPKRYMLANRIEEERSLAELEGLRRLGLLGRPAGPVAADTPYTLTAQGRAEVRSGLNARQLHMLASLERDNLRRRESMEGFAESRQYVEEYARNYGIDAAVARREIDGLAARGLLSRGRLQTENYRIVWKDMHFYVHFLTSLLVTVAVVFVTLVLTSMLGYALARMSFPGKMWVLGLLIVGSVAPREAIIIPVFRMLKALGSLEGLWGMVFWMSGVGIGNTFLMAGFFLTLPKEVEEAAAVDGAGTFRTFFDIALPMARPIVMAVGLFAFLGAWNNFLIPLLCTMSRPTMQPLAVAVYAFQRGHQGWWNQTNAAAAIMIVPVIVVFVVLQKHIVKSIAVGAVKG